MHDITSHSVDIDTDARIGDATLDRRTLLQQAIATFAFTLSGCGSGDSGNSATSTVPVVTAASTETFATTSAACVQPAPGTTPVAAARTGFVHPGLLNTAESLERMRTRVAAGEQPWLSGWNALRADGYSSLTQAPRPLEEVTRPGNFAQMYIDMQRAYILAINWKVTGDTRYADRAVVFLDSWSRVMKRLTGGTANSTDRYLAAGIYGYQWACAAEIMRTYSGWSANGIKAFQDLLRNVFYPISSDFLARHNGADITNYWANWDLVSIAGVMAIGVFCDDVSLYEEAKAYFFSGRGNGTLAHSVYRIHPGHLGQYQESGRDQGHSTLGMACFTAIAEMAWSQGDDLYGEWNNRILSAAEYVAASNLRDANGAYVPLPYAPYSNVLGTSTAISNTGRPHVRPAWEAIYNHYVNRRGLSAPYVSQMLGLVRPEKRDASADGPGLGTLLYSLPPIAKGVAPSGVTARITSGAVVIDWWGTAYATGYAVQRARLACGPFTTLANVDERRTFTDTPPSGTWYYRVSASTSAGTLQSQPVRIAFPGELWFHLPLDEGAGTTVNDATGRFGSSTLAGDVTWGAGRTGGAAALLAGTNGHVVLPDGVMEGLADCTVSLWVHAAAARKSWLFSTGSSDIAFFSLLASDGIGRLRSAATRTYTYGERRAISSSAMPTGRWVHMALTLIGSTATIYVNGVATATSAIVDIAPYQMGRSLQNWLGRSPYPGDPYFFGRMQDLRVHSRGLSATEVAALAAG